MFTKTRGFMYPWRGFTFKYLFPDAMNHYKKKKAFSHVLMY